MTPETSVKITSLPLSDDDRAEFIAVAISVFDYVIERMEPRHPEQTRKLWDADGFVDNILNEEMLPIDREQLEIMFEHFLIGHVANLAAQADERITRMN